jgi:hypothetical protein
LNEVLWAPSKFQTTGLLWNMLGVEWVATIDRRKQTSLYVRCANLEHFEQLHDVQAARGVLDFTYQHSTGYRLDGSEISDFVSAAMYAS